MPKYEALIEVNQEKVENLSQYVSYCKFYFKPKSEEKIEGYLMRIDGNKIDKLEQDFPFLKRKPEKELNGENLKDELLKYLKKNKLNGTLKDFPLNWLKNGILKETGKVFNFSNDGILEKVESISGIYKTSQSLQDYVNNLPEYSFAVWSKFKLQAPYFSKDDDEFHIIQNPILKETNFKVPMIRGSSWKGALAQAFRELFRKSFEGNRQMIESFLRIFGAGSESVKVMEDYISGGTGNLEKVKVKLLEFILFELGLKVDEDLVNEINGIQNRDEFRCKIKDKLSEKLEKQQKLPLEFRTHRGRAIFYPAYFDRLSLEIINPHDRRKRAGINPIHYEVVPEGTDGILQIVYLPYDGILKSDRELKEEVEFDLKNLCKAVEKLANTGIGAKTKLGWGRFSLEVKKCFLNFKFNDKDKENFQEGIDVWEIVES